MGKNFIFEKNDFARPFHLCLFMLHEASRHVLKGNCKSKRWRLLVFHFTRKELESCRSTLTNKTANQTEKLTKTNSCRILKRGENMRRTAAPMTGETEGLMQRITRRSRHSRVGIAASTNRKVWPVTDEWLGAQRGHLWDLETPEGPSHRKPLSVLWHLPPGAWPGSHSKYWRHFLSCFQQDWVKASLLKYTSALYFLRRLPLQETS